VVNCRNHWCGSGVSESSKFFSITVVFVQKLMSNFPTYIAVKISITNSKNKISTGDLTATKFRN
jgi:hypothetical protein